MVVESISQISHQIVHIEELLVAVLAICTVIVNDLILHVERLCHVESIEPDLVRVNLLVPEIAGGSAGLSFELAVHGVNRATILLLASQIIEIKERLSSIYVVEIVLLRMVGVDRTVLLDEIVNEVICKVKVFLLLLDVLGLENGLYHTAVHVVPGRLCTLTDLFNVPDRTGRTAFFQKLIDVAVKNFHNDSGFLSFSSFYIFFF